MGKNIWLMAAMLGLALALAAPAAAQPAARGNLVVQVVTSQGRPVPGAVVRLMGPFRERDQAAGYDGVARFPLLKQGVYELQASKQGLGG